MACQAFDALSCEGLARVDFFLDDERAGARQRGEHDAGLHAVVDVPADVDGQRAGLPGSWSTGWSAPRCPPARPALSRSAGRSASDRAAAQVHQRRGRLGPVDLGRHGQLDVGGRARWW